MTRNRKIIDQAIRRAPGLPSSHRLTNEDRQQVRALSLAHNRTPLAGLARLEWLYLNNNQIADVGPLAELPRLEWLYLDDNPVTNSASHAALEIVRML